MKELTKTVILIAITLALFSSDSGFSYPTPAETGHEPQQNGCDRMRDVFGETLLAYNIPGGMVISDKSNCEGVNSFRGRIREIHSLIEGLDLLVQAVPTYKWLKRDGIVNVEPRDTEAKLLDTRIGRFVYNTSSNLDSITHSLEDTPEIRLEMNRLKLRSGLYFGGLQSPPSKKAGTEIVLHDKTVRQILNGIVQRRGRGLWVYSERAIDHSHSFTLQFVIK